MDSAFLSDQEQAVLVSPVLDQQDWSCVRLVYQITGHGSLHLHLRPESDNFDHRLWTANQASDSWLIAGVDLPNTTIPYQVGMDVITCNHSEPCEVSQMTSLFTLTLGWCIIQFVQTRRCEGMTCVLTLKLFRPFVLLLE